MKTWRDIPGFFDFMDVYDRAVAEAGPEEIFVEVGTFLGKSAAYLADSIFISQKEIALFVVDDWEEKGYQRWLADQNKELPDPWPVEGLEGLRFFDAFKHCVHSASAWEQVVPICARSVEAAKMFEDGSLFFVFIDADHRYPGISSDIAAWRSKIKPGGILAGHDYRVPGWPGVEKAVDEAFTNVEHHGNSWLVRM